MAAHDQRPPDLCTDCPLPLVVELKHQWGHNETVTPTAPPSRTWTLLGLCVPFNSYYCRVFLFMLCQLTIFSVLQLGSSKCFAGGGSAWVKQHITAKPSTSSSLTSWSHLALVSPHFKSDVFSALCIWTKIGWSHWFCFPTRKRTLFVEYCSFVVIEDCNGWHR